MSANCWANMLQISDFPPNSLLILPKDVQHNVFLLVAEQGGYDNWALLMFLQVCIFQFHRQGLEIQLLRHIGFSPSQ